MPVGSRSRDEKAPESPQPSPDKAARRAELLRQRAICSLPAVLLYTNSSSELQGPPEPGTPAAIHELKTTGITAEEQRKRYDAHLRKQRRYDDAAKEPERTAEAIARERLARGVLIWEIGAQVKGGDVQIGNMYGRQIIPPPPRYGGQKFQGQQYQGQQYQAQKYQQPGNTYGQNYGSQAYGGQEYAGGQAGPSYTQQNYQTSGDEDYYGQDYSGNPRLSKGGYQEPGYDNDVPGYGRS